MVLLSSGIKDFHFLPLIKNIKARVTTLSNVSRKADQLKVEQALFNDYNDRGYLGTMAETALKCTRDFSKFPIIIRAADLNHRQN